MKPDERAISEEIEYIGAETHSVVGKLQQRNLAKFIDVITSQLYSDPIGSIVRELTSNCFDAHIKFQKNEIERTGNKNYIYEEPVIVAYTEEEGMGFVSFIDKGTGLSPSDMKNTYINVLTSTKEDNDDEHGYFGIGSKSFLAYTSSIDLVTVYGRTKYHYIVSRNEDGLLVYDLLLTEDIKEHNGTTIKVCIGKTEYIKTIDSYTEDSVNFPAKYEFKAVDYKKFRDAITKQLYYFENLYTTGFDLENDYQIIEADNFKCRTGFNPFKEMHLILGQVAYPISWDLLAIDKIEIPVGVRFNIGELFVNPSREAIRYDNPARKELMIKRISDAVDEIRRRYNEKSAVVDTIEEYLVHLESPQRLLTLGPAQIIISKKQIYNSNRGEYESIDTISGLENVKWRPLAYLPIQLQKDPYHLFYLKGRIFASDKRGNFGLKPSPEEEDKAIFKTVVRNKDKVYRIKEERNKSTDSYLNWKHRNGSLALLIGKSKIAAAEWNKLLNLGEKVTRITSIKGENNLFREGKKKIYTPFIVPVVIEGKTEYWNKTKIIKEYQKALVKDLVIRSGSYEKQELSAEFLYQIQLQKLAKKRKKIEGKITIYDIVNGNGSQSSEFDLATLEKYTGIIVYAEKDKASDLRNVREMLNAQESKRSKKGNFISRTSNSASSGYNNKLRDKACRVFLTAKSNFKNFEGNPYFMHVDEFLNNENRIFRNVVTSWKIDTELNKLGTKYCNLYQNLSRVSDKINDIVKELRDFSYKHINRSLFTYEFMQTCYAIAKERNILVGDKIQRLEEVIAWFGQGELCLFKKIEAQAYVDEYMIQDIVFLLKAKGKRVSNSFYLKKTQELVVPEPVIVPEEVLLLEPILNQLLLTN